MKIFICTVLVASLTFLISGCSLFKTTPNNIEKNNKIKLVVSDVDATLIPSGQKLIPKENIESIKNAVQQGTNVAFISGRPYESVKLSLIEGGMPVDILNNKLIISGLNGADAYKGNTLLFRKAIPKETTKNILDFCSKLDVNVAFISSDNFCMLRKGPWADLYEKRLHYRKVEIPKEPNADAVLKMVIMSPVKNMKTKEKIDKFLQEYKGKIHTIRAIPQFQDTDHPCQWVEIMANNVDKGAAAKKLAEYYNIPLTAVLCIGDAGNDLEMLQIPEVMSVIVGDTKYPELKKIVKFVANPAGGSNPGFSQAINKFVLQNKKSL